MRLYFIFGLPGAGKGVCAQKLKLYKNFVHFSLGDFLRDQVRTETKIGKEYSKEILGSLILLDCDLVSNIVINQIYSAIKHSNNMVIDGFPRTIKQLNKIEIFLKTQDIYSKWLFFDADKETVLLRLLNREHCSGCGIDYILTKTKIENRCDNCGAKLIIRLTDNRHDILKRCDFFYETTNNVIHYLNDKKELTIIPSGGCLEAFSDKFIDEFG